MKEIYRAKFKKDIKLGVDVLRVFDVEGEEWVYLYKNSLGLLNKKHSKMEYSLINLGIICSKDDFIVIEKLMCGNVKEK